MDKRIKKEWVKALRSGEYEQGEASLYKPTSFLGREKFCCLGVLFDSTIESEWEYEEGIWRIPPKGDKCRFDEDLAGSGYLPTWVLKRAGLSNDTQKTLADMNDCGKSFSEIADWIEANL